MNRRNVLSALAVSPAALALKPTEAGAAPEVPGVDLTFVEWLLLHLGAREVEGTPGWVYKADRPEDTGGPFFHLYVRHRDGREFDFYIGIYSRAVTGTPWHHSFDWSVRKELHERYPEEYPDAPTASEWDWQSVRNWPPTTHLDAALAALVEKKDMALFEQRIKDAARAMGVEVEELA